MSIAALITGTLLLVWLTDVRGKLTFIQRRNSYAVWLVIYISRHHKINILKLQFIYHDVYGSCKSQ